MYLHDSSGSKLAKTGRF